jgi:cysteine desulfurase
VKRIYMDHGATTPMREEVLEAMLPFLGEKYGNPSSLHFFGRESLKALDVAREKTASCLGCAPEEILFTSGGTEANNLAIIGVAKGSPPGKNHIITSAVEHHAVLDTVKFLGKSGYDITILPVDEYGMVSPQQVEDAITEQTILVSIMTANNEVGTIMPFEEIGGVCREKGVYFHTDAVQAIGHIHFNLQSQPIDFLSLSAHKFYGPKGVGVLYQRRKTKLEQICYGGGQERKLRPGTENMPGIVGLGKAIELAVANMPANREKLLRLRDQLIPGLLRIGDVRLNGHPEKRLPGNINVSVLFVEGESLLLHLDLKGIALSSGSACTAGSLDPSHVLLAMGLDHQTAQGSLRFTLGRDNTPEDIDYTLEAVRETAHNLRAMSPIYRK